MARFGARFGWTKNTAYEEWSENAERIQELQAERDSVETKFKSLDSLIESLGDRQADLHKRFWRKIKQ